MRTLFTWFTGVIMGGAIGTVIGILFAAEADEETTSRWRKALQNARIAGQKRRAELEAELQQMQEHVTHENNSK